MRFFVNPITKGLMIDVLHGQDIPADAPEITPQQYSHFMGKEIDIGMDGVPFVVVVTPSTKQEVLEQVKSELRPLRNQILADVVQIALVEERLGNATIGDEVLAPSIGVRDRLRDITNDTALNLAPTREEMEVAIVAYYRAIVAEVSPALKSAFKEFEK